MCAELPHPVPPADAADRTQRHLGMVARLADLAMQLAEAAAAKALAQAAKDAEAAAAALPPKSPGADGADHADRFARLALAVGRLITLEAKVAAGWPNLDRERGRGRRTHPRKTRVRQALHRAIIVKPGGPDREMMLHAIDEALDDDNVEELIAEGAPLGDVVLAICNGFDLPVDRKRLPQDFLSDRGKLFPVAGQPPRPPAKTAAGPDPPR